MTTRATAKIFKNGNSQAVRLPKSFQFDVDEVEILRRGDEVIPRKPRQNLSEAFDLLATMPVVELIPVFGLPESASRHYGRIRAALAAAGTHLRKNHRAAPTPPQ